MDFEQTMEGSSQSADVSEALIVKNAWKSYKIGNKKSPVLMKLDMTVQEGTIYALLGASGCGKTTLLTCIVGQQELDHGTIRIFGHPPGSKESGVPGSRLGYMPQDKGLYLECSIREMVTYFGMVHGMSQEDIHSRMAFLIKFLQLPHKDRLIHTLSGGQQKRVSLCLALLNEPEILILDEPTVGVDPLVRQAIWSHLRELASVSKTTIILTTHYMEEARHAQVVGMMRSGRLLEEDSPTSLMRMYHSQTLEGVFLSLCLEDDRSGANKMSIAAGRDQNKQVSLFDNASTAPVPKARKYEDNKSPLSSYRATLYMDMKWVRGNIYVFLLVCLTPPILTLMYCMYVGGDPKDLPFAVVNNEWPTEPICQPQRGCSYQNLSCTFIKNLDHNMLRLVPYDDEVTAIESIRKGNAWGLISFPSNYSSSVQSRFSLGLDADNGSLVNSRVKINMDMTNAQMSLVVMRMIALNQVASSCKDFTALTSAPIDFGQPIYGSNDISVQEYVAPGIATLTIFSGSLGFAAGKLIMARMSGVPQRARTSGVSTKQEFCAFVTFGTSMMMAHTLSALGVMWLYLGVSVTANWVWLFCILFLQGLCGFILGCLAAQRTQNIGALVVVFFALTLPNMFLSGLLWPLEGISRPWLRWLCKGMVSTLAYDASRSIISRGWGILHSGVWPGFVAITVWSGVFTLGIFIYPQVSKGLVPSVAKLK